MRTRLVGLLALALVAACGSATAPADVTVTGRWTLRTINGAALPQRINLWSAYGYAGSGTAQSGHLTFDGKTGYLMDMAVTDYIAPNLSRAPTAPNEDFGTATVSGAALTLTGLYGEITGSVRGDTLHEVFKSVDYAYTR